MTRDQVKIEFSMRQDRAGWTVDAEHWQVNAMADEILKVRQERDELLHELSLSRLANEEMGKRLDAVEAERDDAIINRRLSDEQRGRLFSENAHLLRTLAALREPNEAVLKAGIEHYWDLMLSDPVDMDDVRESIRAAVTAAEQEVGDAAL